MKEFAIKVWKDSVGSKLIALAIAGIIGYIYALIKDISFTQLISQFWNIPVKLGYIFLVISALYIISLIRKRFKGLSRIQKEIKTFNSLEFVNFNVKAKWEIKFDKDKKPFAYNIQSFCTLHDFPLILSRGRCTDAYCKNASLRFTSSDVKNEVDSRVIHCWDVLNGREEFRIQK